MHLLCDPNPFCFGSTSSMLAVVSKLRGERVTVLGTGTTLDLCDGMEVVRCDVKDASALDDHGALLDACDVYVAFSNNTNVERVLAKGIPLVFVDLLFWMKRRRTLAMEHAEFYVIENYPGVSEKLVAMPPARPLLVGPLIAAPPPREGARVPVFANLGGASSPDLVPGANTNYPSQMTAMLDQIADRMGISKIIVAMGSAAAATVTPGRHTQPRTLSHARYLRELMSARTLLTAPGLNAPLEAFQYGVPVSYLPPQNLTQVFHLKVYVDAGLAPAGLDLSTIVPEVAIDMRAPEREGTAAVLEALRRIRPATWVRIEEQVQHQLERTDAQLRDLAARQTEWVRGLGVAGAKRTAEAIRAVLA